MTSNGVATGLGGTSEVKDNKGSIMNRLMGALAMVTLTFAVGNSASAASVNLNFTSGYVGATNQINYAYGEGQSLTVSGLSATNSNYYNSGILDTVGVTQNGSWGLYTTGGTHAITNQYNANTSENQMLLLDFGQAVTLDTFTLSWTHHNNGVPNYGSVLAYTDSGLFTHNGLRWDDLLDSGFSHAGNPNAYKNMHANQAVTVQGGILSQYWLIGAINPIFGGTTDKVADAFKLGGISFTTVDVSEVPLPAAAWLFLTGLAGMTWLKKRKAQRELALQVA